MGWSTSTFTLDDVPVQIVATAAGWVRRAEVVNIGPAPCWLGDSNVRPGAGRLVRPGDVVVHDGPDAVWAVCWNVGRVEVSDRLR